jgi:hypothetical protein
LHTASVQSPDQEGILLPQAFQDGAGSYPGGLHTVQCPVS